MADIDTVNINGTLISWQDADLKFGGDGFHGFTSISYGAKRPRGLGYGAGRSGGPRGRSRGKTEFADVKLKGYKDSIQKLRAWVAARGGSNSYGDPEFPGVLQYLGPDGEPIVVKWERLCIVDDPGSAEEGSDPLQDEITLQPMGQTINGLTIASAQ